MTARLITTLSGFARSRSPIHARRGTSEAMSHDGRVVTTLAVVMLGGGHHAGAVIISNGFQATSLHSN
jgi:hypothetical protein